MPTRSRSSAEASATKLREGTKVPLLSWAAGRCMFGCVAGVRAAARATRSVGFDQAGRLAGAGVTAAFDERRATRTTAALTAMIDRRPTHCSASPMPSPQYGLEGPTSTGMAWKNVNAAISIHATTEATWAADRCLQATRAPAMRTATRLE